MNNEGRFSKVCGDCFWFLDVKMEGGQFTGGTLAGDCHERPPVAGAGWPKINPECTGCGKWKKSNAPVMVITPVETPDAPIVAKEEECPPTNTSVNVDKGQNISQKPGDEFVPKSPADVAKELNESRPVLDSLSGGPVISTSPTKTKP